MNVNELLGYLCSHKGAIRRSALEISRRTHSDINSVYEAKRKFKTLHYTENIEEFPRILIFDIETAPVKAFVWKLWKENVSIDQIIDDWFVICWSAKWLYSNDVLGDCVTSQEILEEDDERVVKSLWKLFDEADIIVAHNALGFDVPKMNARFIKHGLNPPSPYRVIDTYQVVKKHFNFSSNKLDALAVYFGYDRKLDTDFTLWKLCMQGKQASLDYMFKYNKQDVKLLEEIYIKLIPWIKNHPNINNYLNSEKPVCSNCGSKNVEIIPNKYYYTQMNKYKVYRCKNCGAVSRDRININGKKVKATSVAT